MSISRAILLSMLPVGLALAQPNATGAIQGSVIDSQSQPLAGAVVRYLSVAASVAAGAPMPLPGETVVTGSAVADASGSFTVAGLPSGTVLLCASVPRGPYLDSCVWGQAVRAEISSGATVAQKLMLTKGVYLNVRINDPSGLLPQAMDGPWTPRKLLVGVVYGAGSYQAAMNTSVDSMGRNYRLLIPAAKTFSLWLYSTDVALGDSSGTALSSSAGSLSFQAASGQDQNFTFTVTGPASRAQ